MVPVGQVYQFPDKTWGRKGVTIHPASQAALTISPSGVTIRPAGKTAVTVQATGVTIQPSGVKSRATGLTITQGGTVGLTISPR
jgi:hypothetical protein